MHLIPGCQGPLCERNWYTKDGILLDIRCVLQFDLSDGKVTRHQLACRGTIKGMGNFALEWSGVAVTAAMIIVRFDGSVYIVEGQLEWGVVWVNY